MPPVCPPRPPSKFDAATVQRPAVSSSLTTDDGRALTAIYYRCHGLVKRLVASPSARGASCLLSPYNPTCPLPPPATVSTINHTPPLAPWFTLPGEVWKLPLPARVLVARAPAAASVESATRRAAAAEVAEEARRRRARLFYPARAEPSRHPAGRCSPCRQTLLRRRALQ